MNQQTISAYRIRRPSDDRCFVVWEGVFVDAHPAEKSEDLCLQLSQDDGLHAGVELTIDMTHCGEINSSGIAFLIYFRRRMKSLGIRWGLSNVSPVMERMLRMLNLETEFQLSAGELFDYGERGLEDVQLELAFDQDRGAAIHVPSSSSDSQPT